ncbi:DotA/TraY family protein [Thiotrichales bacterium 19S3-7]|nr:DotA/TraY family protein [Thiotrichales bacterium 19S3-7]MCF6801989.1 DotA/TraY family protein [Thiotrichales bacterium 19S3-11]
MSSMIWGGAVADSDKSQDVLYSIFGGNVQDLLTQVNTTLFSVTFKYFNAGLLSIVFVLYAFIIIVGTINTARDGQFLGKNWSGHWISLRAIFGTIFAVPTATGYCAAQYLIFAMVTAGISFADYVWKNIVDDVVSGNVPAVVSSEVVNNINTYLATFMMSNLTKDLLENDTFVQDEASSGNLPCIKSATATKVKITIPQAYVLGQDGTTHIPYDGSNGNVAGTDYIQKDAYVYPITCKVSFSTQVSGSFVQSYAQPLAASVAMNSDGSLDSDVTPFKDYAKTLGNGLASWSDVSASGDQYVQYKLNTSDWVGKFTVNQMVNQPDQADVNDIAGKYDLSDPSYLTVNLIEHPYAFDSNYDDKDNVHYSPTALSNTSSEIINWMEQNSASMTSGCSGDTDNLCYKAEHYGWWDADQLYLDFDNSLSQNLQNLYANFAEFSNAANLVANQTSIPVDYDYINIHYTKNSNDIDDLIKGNEISFNPLTADEFQFMAQADLEPFKDELSNSGSFTISMSTVRQLFNQIINDDNKLSTDEKSMAADAVNRYLSDGMQFQYAEYLYIMYSITNAVYSPYMNTKVNDSVRSLEADKLYNMVVLPVTNLFAFFSQNNVDFGGNQNPTDTSSVTDPAEEVLTEIFDQLGTNSSSAEVGGLMAAIYNIGVVPEDLDGNFAAQNFSMIQNVQAIGISLIEGTINSMIGIFNHAKDELNEIKESAESDLKGVEQDAKYWSAGNALSLGAVSNTASAQIALEYAEVMLDVTMQMATFSLSLMWLPLVMFVLTTIFTIGISFSLIIPLTPYILFWAGKTAWLLLVIEAMAAAPIVSLGLVYPEGSEIFGKAEPGIQICMNLVLRPVFMILGMIFGIGLTYIVIQYSAEGFHAITDSLLGLMPTSNGTDAAAYARGTFSCMLIFLYSTFLSMAFMKCFSLIYLIPDKVLQWIGNTRGERAGEAEIQEFKGAGMQYAQGAAQAGGQSMQQGIEAEKSNTQSMIQSKSEVSKSTSQRNLAISNDSAQAAKQAGEAALMM